MEAFFHDPSDSWGSSERCSDRVLARTMKAAIKAFEALKALPVSAAIVDSSGTIVAVNDAWKQFGRRNGLRIPDSGVSANYLQYCGSGEPQSSEFAKDLRDLLAGRLDLLTLIYPCHSPSKERWFCLIGLPLSLDKPAGVALLHVNLTDMLPLSTGARPLQSKAGRSGQIHTMTKLGAISGAIERSVSETLSSQLNAMFTGSPRGSAQEKTSADRETEQILADAQLSARQLQILSLLGRGKTNREIADMLFRSPNTIKLHVSAILQRLKLKSRTQAALVASRMNKEDSTDIVGSSTTTWRRARPAATQPKGRGQPYRTS